MHQKRTKAFAMLVSLVLVLAFAAGCAPAPAEPTPTPTMAPAVEQPTPEPVPEAAGFKAGTYTAEVKAYGGPMVVEVTVSDSAITNIVVKSHGETNGIGTVGVEQMPSRILEAQSVGLDTITGCTISSASVLAAVKAALTDAGGDMDALTKKVEVPAEDKSLEADVVVVGGGLAGLAAAVGAVDEGASVILLEKAGFTGGATATSGGEILAAGTFVQKEAGVTDSAQALVDYWLEKGEGGVDEDMVRYVGETSPETIQWLADMGTKFSLTTPTSFPWQDPMRCHKTAEGMASTTGTGGGVGVTIPMTEYAMGKGVQFLYETPAQSLIMEGDAVVGVEALTKQGGKVTIRAKQVILATGGYDSNKEMMKEHAPLVLGLGRLGAQHNGDGHVMAESAGAEMLYHNSSVVNLAFDMGPTFLFSDVFGQYLYVLPDGNRFMDESQYWFIRSGNLIKNNVSYYWLITDSAQEIANMDAAIAAGTAKTGATIEELAANMGVDPATLAATVERYNTICATGIDVDFGKTNANLEKVGMPGTVFNSVKTGPFYAIQCGLNSVSGTLGGPKITLDGQVLNKTGQVISGLYAAGEVANAQFFNVYYPCSGSSLQYCATMGRRAGAHAANNK